VSTPAFAGSTLGSLIRDAAEQLHQSGIEGAWNEALLLCCHASGLPKAALLTRLDQPGNPGDTARIEQLIARRIRREPVAYLLGEREFYGRPFFVDHRALIPRPETELLVETAVQELRRGPQRPLVVDVGTGTACIAATLAIEAPSTRLIAADLSPSALDLARANLARHGLTGSVHLVRGNLLSWLGAPPDLVVANLPYIPSETWDSLPPDVREFEPRLALDGGPGGAVLIHELLGQAARLGVGGLLAELDPRHAGQVHDAVRAAFPDRVVEVLADLAGRQRLLRVARPE
jgi:release factor glutamine methyltransferase